jgi:hypothetical protein
VSTNLNRDIADRLCDESVEDRDLSETDVFRALGYEVKPTRRGPYKRGLDSPRWTSLSRPFWSLEDARRLVEDHAPGASVELSWGGAGGAMCTLRARGPGRGSSARALAPTPQRALVAALLLLLGGEP